MVSIRALTTALITLLVTGVMSLPGWALPISSGDRLRIFVPADDELPEGDRLQLSGVYEINLDGKLLFPFVTPIAANGLEAEELEQRLRNSLIENGFFRDDRFQISVQVLQWAPVQVTVAGEVFNPGRVLINALPLTDRDGRPRPRAQELINTTGEAPSERFLSAAIRSVGGLKPNADIRNIRLIRGKQEQIIDLSGAFTGEPVDDVPLIAGDQVIVPQLEVPQTALVRPSQLTPSEIPVIMSNLSEPARRGSQILTMPYGTRLSQVVVAANCAGGNKVTNAKRRVSLVQTDRLTGQTRVSDYAVERLLRTASRNSENPFLMPQDSVVCYDSTVSTASGVLGFVSDIFAPFFLIQRLFENND
jgi:polysaccharide biosynthesis/export protein